MATSIMGWFFIDGAEVPQRQKLYGKLNNIDNLPIYYGATALRIANKTNVADGAVYRICPLSTLPHGSNFNNIPSIDTNYTTLLQDISTIDLSINIYNSTGDTYGSINEDFAVTESSIIFYAASNKLEYNRNDYILVLIDEDNEPRIVGISAKYKGLQIPVGETFAKKDIEVHAIYENGTTKLLTSSVFEVEPPDFIILNVGSNLIKVTYEDRDGIVHPSEFVITGVRAVVNAYGRYTGPPVAYGKEAERKYFEIIVVYSDNSEDVTTDYVFPEGLVVTERNGGDIHVYCKSYDFTVHVDPYRITSSRLVAYYNGPNVEVNKLWDKQHVTVKIYYANSDGSNGSWDRIDLNDINLSMTPNKIDHEGINQITVQYNGRLGTVTTNMAIIGIKPDVVLRFIDVDYTGPEIVEGRMFSIENVIVRAHYSNGEIITVPPFGTNNFRIEPNYQVNNIGENVFNVIYDDTDGGHAERTFVVIGIEADSTTEDGYTPVSLDNNYPEATRHNNRYRGPAESLKHERLSRDMYENIHRLYKIFYSIEKDFNAIINSMSDTSAMKYTSLNVAEEISVVTEKRINDERYITGHYQPLENDDE